MNDCLHLRPLKAAIDSQMKVFSSSSAFVIPKNRAKDTHTHTQNQVYCYTNTTELHPKCMYTHPGVCVYSITYDLKGAKLRNEQCFAYRATQSNYDQFPTGCPH